MVLKEGRHNSDRKYFFKQLFSAISYMFMRPDSLKNDLTSYCN